MATKYFGDDDPINKTISIDRQKDFVVRGVVENPPKNSHLKFNYLLPMQNLRSQRNFTAWGSNRMYTYILLDNKADAEIFEHKISQVLSDEIANPNWQPRLYLQSLADIHLYSDFDFNTDFAETGNLQSMYLFGAIGLIILLISCINFINLSTARSFQRSKEIGVRKVMGAGRRQLICQFIGESLLFTFISIVFAIALTQICIPYIANLSGLPLSLDLLKTEYLVGLSVAILLITGFFAGIYPAFFMSAFNTIRTLKSSYSVKEIKGGRVSIRTVLVVSQFTFSIILFVSAIIVSEQMHHILNRDLGFDKEHIIYMSLKGELMDDEHYRSFKSTLLQQSSIHQLTRSNSLPIDHEGSFSGLKWEGMAEVHQDFLMNYFEVDEAFVETFGLQIITGNDFSNRNPTDTLSYYLINETAQERMQLSNPVGKKLGEGRIVGAIKDFNFKSAFNPVEPMILRNGPDMFQKFVSIKIASGNIKEALTTSERIFKEFNPSYPFEYHFLDDSIETLYNQTIRTGKFINLFAVLAVFISCLGLFGLSTFTVEQRTKEIGIRKVLGATVTGIIGLLSKDFLKLVALGFVIAVPVAWYAMSSWLANFAYKIDISLGIFLLAGGVAFFIALVTVSWQSISAALTNPVESLRSD